METSKHIDNIGIIKKTAINYVFHNTNLDLPIQIQPIEVEGIGTGCMLLKRIVYEKMLETFGEENLKYILDKKYYYKFFDNMISENKEYISEDYYFCKKWYECGGKVYLATWFECTHWGNYGYNSN